MIMNKKTATKKAVPKKPTKKRAAKYETKLHIKGSLNDVLNIIVKAADKK